MKKYLWRNYVVLVCKVVPAQGGEFLISISFMEKLFYNYYFFYNYYYFFTYFFILFFCISFFLWSF